MSKEKIYAVEFMEYTNCSNCTVAKYGPDKIKDTDYLDVGLAPFLVKESDIDKYKEFGGGFKSLIFVGNMEI